MSILIPFLGFALGVVAVLYLIGLWR